MRRDDHGVPAFLRGERVDIGPPGTARAGGLRTGLVTCCVAGLLLWVLIWRGLILVWRALGW